MLATTTPDCSEMLPNSRLRSCGISPLTTAGSYAITLLHRPSPSDSTAWTRPTTRATTSAETAVRRQLHRLLERDLARARGGGALVGAVDVVGDTQIDV